MHSVCCCSLLVWRSFLKKGTPREIFLPRPGSAPGRIWPKIKNTCKEPWVLNAYQVSSKSIKRFWRRSWNCEILRTTTDGRTDDGGCAMTIAHLSLRLRWAYKHSILACNSDFDWLKRLWYTSIHLTGRASLSTTIATPLLRQFAVEAFTLIIKAYGLYFRVG